MCRITVSGTFRPYGVSGRVDKGFKQVETIPGSNLIPMDIQVS